MSRALAAGDPAMDPLLLPSMLRPRSGMIHTAAAQFDDAMSAFDEAAAFYRSRTHDSFDAELARVLLAAVLTLLESARPASRLPTRLRRSRCCSACP